MRVVVLVPCRVADVGPLTGCCHLLGWEILGHPAQYRTSKFVARLQLTYSLAWAYVPRRSSIECVNSYSFPRGTPACWWINAQLKLQPVVADKLCCFNPLLIMGTPLHAVCPYPTAFCGFQCFGSSSCCHLM